ncbi:MAG TPA: 3-hydroxyacyl-ACP dehydratase FabZ [Gammaproteobacteria bacterium]|jgi:3-hydroxyacyl-[acyl-carrier-protein] dehydratase|nr:3-hydroxyacyl-ACP dehydratase FabZ [Gammaproteobacteria bacterium]
MAKPPFMDIQAIMKQLPHRYPFLLLDRVIDCTPGESLTALKNVTINEPFFPGHFPQRAVMPGVLILEAMAQATGLLAFATIGHPPGPNELYYFVGIDKARFREMVVPGDQILFKVKILAAKRNIWKFSGVAEVDGKVAAEAELMCAGQVHEE